MDEKSRKQRILIVDDAPENIKILGEVLKSEYSVSFATNGENGLRIARSENPPDLILLDIIMPGLNGYEVCQRLKADEKTRNIPIIFITAMNDVEDETRGLELGAVDYITKPFSSAIVKARVRTHLELKRHRDMLENLSAIDGLTGIPNRRRFDELFNKEWRLAVREHSLLTMIMIDIDYFKRFNDKYLHVAGDDCLRKVAETLAASVKRPTDFVARYGGEEFAAVLPRTDSQGAAFIGETMRKNIMALNIAHERSPVMNCVTISVGAATTTPERGISSEILIRGADDALYKAKKRGRNQMISLNLDEERYDNRPEPQVKAV